MPAPEYRPIPGSERDPLPGAFIIGRPNPRRRIQVTVVLRHPAQGKELAVPEELALTLPKKRTYLTRAEFEAAHSADPAEIGILRRFARAHRLKLCGRIAAARAFHLCGRIGDFSRAFRTPLFLYRYAGGVYRGRTGPIRVPAELDGVVEGVFGLDNRPQARPHVRRLRRLGGAWPHAGAISYTPNQVAKLYDYPQPVSGKGQCIGIIELGGGYTQADLVAYFQRLGIPAPNVSAISVRGGQNAPTGNPNGPDGEVMLDIEVAGAVAPGARIVVYFAPNTDQGFLRAIARAVHDKINQPSVISISWGGPEASWTKQSLNAMNNVIQAAATLGVTVCCAAGDGGSSDGVPGRLAHVDFPASSPFALACGGTRLNASDGTISGETVWNDGPGGGATGGGVSDFFPLPSWQSKAGVPPSINPGNFVGRGLPDVAGDADPQTGYSVRVDRLDTVIGGTSAVAPLWAGLTALINENLGTSVGYLNPLLYKSIGSKAGVFHDITKGNNDMTGQVGGYKAKAGWDPCSGFGSPDGTALLNALQGAGAKGKSD